MSARSDFLPEGIAAYLSAHSVRETTVQRALRAATKRQRMAMMQISPEQGALMQVLARMIGAKRYLEIGTYTGYSALCVALAMPKDGRLVCCDISEEWTSIARRYWAKAGIRRRIDLRLGPALATLDALLREKGRRGSFDFAFIDADKQNYAAYYERALRLVRRGGLIAIDNTLWGGSVTDPADHDASTRAIRAFNRKVHRDPRVAIAMLPVGDGLTLAVRR